ncbi:MAG: alanine racemase [Aquificae bacterium]|nr:alanine racemase [Aquificota bacterium]
MDYRSWAEIDLNRLEKNIENIYSFVKKDIFAVVKADAYGHGAVNVSKHLDNIPFVKKLCVATAEEGKELREAGIKKDILVLGGILPEEINIFKNYNLKPVISDFKQLALVKELSCKGIHIKFDTGMHRLGFYKDALEKIYKIIKQYSLYVEGIMSHFPSADMDKFLTQKQIAEFYSIYRFFLNKGFKIPFVHIQNSAGLVYDCPFCNAVRVGLAVYGEKPLENFPIPLLTVMSVKAKLISRKKLKKGESVSYCGTYTASRDMEIGIVSFGYADGLPRNLSNKGYFLINGKKAPIIGNITMDMTIVDITNIDVKEGDPVLIVGKNGYREIKFSDVAKMCDTIPYEIMCRISKRVKRFIKYNKNKSMQIIGKKT